jgi:hypothetical protein
MSNNIFLPNIALLAIIAFTISGCTVREQAFGCEGLTAETQTDEFVMTPTSLRFQSVTYGFTEERNSLRIYTQRKTGSQIEFNPASGLLEQGTSKWQCKRIGLD